MVKIPHLAQYQGSKRNLAPKILEYIPLKFNRLIEPFAGYAAISIACSSEKRAEKYLIIIITDVNDLQIDHRVPFEVGGDFVAEQESEYYMLLSPSANRLKSWTCEKCENWNDKKIKEAFPKLQFWESNLRFIGKSGLQTAFSRAFRKTNRVLGKAQKYMFNMLLGIS